MISMKDQSSLAHATSLPPLLLQEKTILRIMFLKKFVYANSGSGLLFIMCGHCSPLVVWYNYHGT